jgi:hypothetical protein
VNGHRPARACPAAGGDREAIAGTVRVFDDLFMKGKDPKALATVLRGFAAQRVTEAELRAVKVPAWFIDGSRKVPVQFIDGSREVKFLTDGIDEAKKVVAKAGAVVIDKGAHVDTFTLPECHRAVVEFPKANMERARGE